MTPVDEVSRRDFLHVMAAPMIAAGSASQVAGADCSILAPPHHAALTQVLNELIPSSGGLPAAGDLGIARFVEQAAVASPRVRNAVVTVLNSFAEMSSTGVSGEWESVLREVEKCQPDEFGVLIHAAYTGYYSSPVVLTTLGWVDPAAEPKLLPFDLTILPPHSRTCENA